MTPDEQEASSWKYFAPQVVPLSSGNFAIFNLYTITEGLVLATICSEAELPSLLRAFFSSIQEKDRAEEERRQYRFAHPHPHRLTNSNPRRSHSQTESLA